MLNIRNEFLLQMSCGGFFLKEYFALFCSKALNKIDLGGVVSYFKMFKAEV